MAFCDKCGNYDKSHIEDIQENISTVPDEDYQPDAEFVDEAQNYWEDHYDDVVTDIKEYANSKFKKPMGDRNVN